MENKKTHTCKYESSCSYPYCCINDEYYKKEINRTMEEVISSCAEYRFEEQAAHVDNYKMYKARVVMGFTCRMVGPGGTDLDFYVTKEGLRGIWTNENCPYTSKEFTTKEGKVLPDITACEGYDGKHFPWESSDGHNVSKISWEDLADIVDMAKKEGYL